MLDFTEKTSICRHGMYLLFSVALLLQLGGCGSITGIPAHGGGKRFAVEQELVAAATRATVKKIDLTTIRGKKVNLFVNAIGDTGTGNMVGGRYSLVSQLRGDYIQTPSVTEKSIYPRYTATSTGGSGTQSVTETLLPSSEQKTSQQKGGGGEAQIGLEYKGLGSYQNSTEISSDDLQYLSGLLESYLFLQGVIVVPPSEAEIDVYITVDVFGTVRTRVEWFLANNEILRAKTALEVMAVEHLSGKLVMVPQSAAIEAEYNEQYILWAGPVSITKYLRNAEPLLADFSELSTPEESAQNESLGMAAQDAAIPYPFQFQIERWKKDNE
ncbi:adhesin [Desulfopila sp. IMCC35006]|uniref:adhesin n=1 Tax=Desulfopila sp. IMCC35006 TaxID=2569542 RepID=UPI0010AC13DD|nr:adhesin [Desulfopila sp. IMCC35006]TKB23233.1 adhesin [Desulfopila sp. IMCC35006]